MEECGTLSGSSARGFDGMESAKFWICGTEVVVVVPPKTLVPPEGEPRALQRDHARIQQ